MTVIICAPHPDDEMIGMGGTIAKLSSEGERVIVVIFTLGEGSHPWQKAETINKTRKEEAVRANKIAGTTDTVFLELADGRISTEVVEKNTEKEFLNILAFEKPRMLFTPAIDDIHNDHRAVARFALSTAEKHDKELPVWMYTVWNPLHFRHRDKPRLVINIRPYFLTKWRAIQAYESQKISTFQLIPTVLLRGLINGLSHGYSMAEVFVKAR